MVWMRFWSKGPPPIPGFELMLALLIEKFALGRAPAISCCASADSTARRAVRSSRLFAKSSASASASVRARAQVAATQAAKKKIALITAKCPLLEPLSGDRTIRRRRVHTLAPTLPNADAAMQYCAETSAWLRWRPRRICEISHFPLRGASMPVKVSMKVNGKAVSAELEARTLLVTYIRDGLRLTGTHVGCDTAQCGACTVLMNGKAIKSCSIVAMQAEGADILTIEGGAPKDGTLHPMQAASKENHA